MKFTPVALFFAAVLVSSCAMNEDVLPPEPEMVSIDRTETALSVAIDPTIQNEFEVSANGAPAARFLKYRSTIENAFRTTFSKSFSSVRFTDAIPRRGVFVRLSQAAPKPISMSKKIGLEISWAGEIYRDGIRVHRSEGKAQSLKSVSPDNRGTEILKDAFRVMTEQLGSEIRAIAAEADPQSPVAGL